MHADHACSAGAVLDVAPECRALLRTVTLQPLAPPASLCLAVSLEFAALDEPTRAALLAARKLLALARPLMRARLLGAAQHPAAAALFASVATGVQRAQAAAGAEALQ
jgi:hypothetical protein